MKNIIVVCGLGRCGSSLTMQMLNAGGISCSGEYPTFEESVGNVLNQRPDKLLTLEGKAIKILLPDEYNFKEGNYKFIWVDRDPFENAKSQYKFAKLIVEPTKGIELPSGGKVITRFAKDYVRKRDLCLHHISNFGPVLALKFEDIIIWPEKQAKKIVEFLGLSLDIEKMVNQVVPRSTQCSSNLQIEIDLMEKELAAK